MIKDDIENSYRPTSPLTRPTTAGLVASTLGRGFLTASVAGISGVVGGEVVAGIQMIRPQFVLIGISSTLPVFAS